ncbi:MAG TPA: choice-of-anchor Q domain-containing protein, partial [bacterium]|nr:choice-of-anchor Q domain-containing protein [bacterium]
MKTSVFSATLVALVSFFYQGAYAADCTVTNANDAGAGSFRACLAQATADGDVVTIAPEVTSPILLTTGALNIDAGIRIAGAGPGVSVIDGSGNGNNRIVTLDASVTGKSVSISGLTIQGGNLSAEGSAILVDRNSLSLSDCVLQNNQTNGAHGGAVMVAGVEATLSVDSCQFLDNRVQGVGNGGAIYSNGSLFISNSTFSGNGTNAGQGGKGGAIYLNAGVAQVLNSTFSQNSADGDGGAIYNVSFNDLIVHNSVFDGNRNLSGVGIGGAIFNEREALVLSDSDFTGNTAGGAIFNEGLMVADRCYFSGNSSANFDGGAIQNEHIMILRNSVVIGNSVSPGQGGGVYVNGQALIENSTVANNTSDFNGGGIYVTPGTNAVAIDNSTIFGNEAAGNGGGIFAGETTFLNNVTIAGNTAASGGGIYTSFETYFSNSIVAGNSAGSGPDCFYFAGLFIANGPNLVQDTAACTFTGDVQETINQDPLLAGELAANGGPGIGQNGAQPLLTIALQAESLALDAGNDASCRPTDQRGIARPQGEACDLGAFEAGATADLSASDLNFGEQIVGTVSEVQTATLANNGLIPLVINGAAVGGDADDFTVDNGCGATLAPGESCSFAVSFV